MGNGKRTDKEKYVVMCFQGEERENTVKKAILDMEKRFEGRVSLS